MATLYVENVPDPIYEALRQRARANHKSIAAEVHSLLEANVITPDELARRRQASEMLRRVRARKPLSTGASPTAEEMVREDRDR
jgi:plasmid stability protein